MPPKRKDPFKEAEVWNKKVKVGDEVKFFAHPFAEPELFKTRTEASVLGFHTAVVWLEGKSGCVSLDACRPASH